MSTITLPWQQPKWHDEVHFWIRQNLQEQDLKLAGEIEQTHLRPWSTVMTVPTQQGIVYFKATTPMLVHEPALTRFLASQRPDILPELLAVDVARGWMLMRDSGTPIREFVKVEKSISRWLDVLPVFAEFQIQMSKQVDQLLSVGALDRRLEILPQDFRSLLTDKESMLLDQPEGLTSHEYERLQNLIPEFTRMCEELSDFGIPESVHHGDLSNSNVYLKHSKIIFTDWAGNHPVKSYQSEVEKSWQNRARRDPHEEIEVFRKPDREHSEGSRSRSVAGRTDSPARV
jgi:hypothetical protein